MELYGVTFHDIIFDGGLQISDANSAGSLADGNTNVENDITFENCDFNVEVLDGKVTYNPIKISGQLESTNWIFNDCNFDLDYYSATSDSNGYAVYLLMGGFGNNNNTANSVTFNNSNITGANKHGIGGAISNLKELNVINTTIEGIASNDENDGVAIRLSDLENVTVNYTNERDFDRYILKVNTDSSEVSAEDLLNNNDVTVSGNNVLTFAGNSVECSLGVEGNSLVYGEIETTPTEVIFDASHIQRIYFYDQAWWNAYGAITGVYLWDSQVERNNSWPGVAITHVTYLEETKQNLYYFDLDTSLYDSMIFVRGGINEQGDFFQWNDKDQTVDILYQEGSNCFTLDQDNGVEATGVWSNYTPAQCQGFENIYFVDMPWWNEGATYETYLYAENTETLVNNDADGLGVKMNVVDTVDGRNVLYANFDTAVYNSFTFVRYNTETGETLKTSSNTLVDGNNVFALYKENSTDLFSYSY